MSFLFASKFKELVRNLRLPSWELNAWRYLYSSHCICDWKLRFRFSWAEIPWETGRWDRRILFVGLRWAQYIFGTVIITIRTKLNLRRWLLRTLGNEVLLFHVLLYYHKSVTAPYLEEVLKRHSKEQPFPLQTKPNIIVTFHRLYNEASREKCMILHREAVWWTVHLYKKQRNRSKLKNDSTTLLIDMQQYFYK